MRLDEAAPMTYTVELKYQHDSGGPKMAKGTCDVCDASSVKVTRVEVTGIETYACGKCRGDDPRRCETNECAIGGECIHCGAINGEMCQDD